MARYGAVPPPFYEDALCCPQDPYGIGKLCAEKILKNLCEVHGLEYVIAVPHNIIGPRQKYDDPFRNVASIMINMVLQGRAPIIYGDGTQKRCFSFIDDCLQCLTRMAFDPALNGQTINIGPDEEVVTINELASTIMDIIGRPMVARYEKGRPQEVRHAVCSSDKARKLLNYKTTVSLERGLEQMVKWIEGRGPKNFDYHLPIEIVSEKTPKTWTNKMF
jgi:UDP-glucose 4-epimerase